MDIANNSDMEVVIIRPLLIYGPGVKGNFETMIKVVKSGFPLPLSPADNKRSLIALDNLVDLIVTCIDHPNAGNRIFLISDGKDVSSLDLVKETSKAFGAHLYIFPVLVALMKIAAKRIGKGLIADCLFSDLRVDSSKTEELLDWKPVVSMGVQLKKITDYDKLGIDR